ncbi:Uncharacterised protein [Salmonella bongori]|nr:Uncharacterised protein [Salmonella bongori]
MVRCVFTWTQLLLPAAAEAMVRIRLPGQTAWTSWTPTASAVTNDGRNVMRFVDLLHADRQIGLTPGEHFTYPRITLCIHLHFILQIASVVAADYSALPGPRPLQGRYKQRSNLLPADLSFACRLEQGE